MWRREVTANRFEFHEIHHSCCSDNECVERIGRPAKTGSCPLKRGRSMVGHLRRWCHWDCADNLYVQWEPDTNFIFLCIPFIIAELGVLSDEYARKATTKCWHDTQPPKALTYLDSFAPMTLSCTFTLRCQKTEHRRHLYTGKIGSSTLRVFGRGLGYARAENGQLVCANISNAASNLTRARLIPLSGTRTLNGASPPRGGGVVL